MRFLLYAHGGAYNHGAEAIVQATISLIRSKYPKAWIGISTHYPEQDEQFGITADQLIPPDYDIWDQEKRATSYEDKIDLARKMYSNALSEITPETVLLSVGGDNYCYGNWHRLAVFQEVAQKKGAKSILWGASVEPSQITKDMVTVLNTYTQILVRESITYRALLDKKVTAPISILPDIAFRLPVKNIPLPATSGCIGINFSPLVLRREISKGILIKNFRKLVDRVIEEGLSAVLIPHVTVAADNDLNVLRQLYTELSPQQKKRVKLVDEGFSAQEYKYLIANCRFLVCSRTHASIAAYSTGVPTVVIGYSVKSIGIAEDLGIPETVLNIEKINAPDVLTDHFKEIFYREKEYSVHLSDMVAEFITKTEQYYNYI